MASNFYSANSSFPFDRMSMSKPVSSGGNHLIKFSISGSPVYVQPPKCTIRGAPGNKKHCDLVFSQENDEFLGWIETLENICQTRLFDNRNTWFETPLEMEDIENMFTTTTKLYKNGKYYILRANIPYKMGVMSLKIYDENECETYLERINEEMFVMSVLEIHGIKCTSRNFQLEIEVKQILVLKPVDIFEKCILKRQILEEEKPLAVKPIVFEQEKDQTQQEEEKQEQEKQQEEEPKEEPKDEETRDETREEPKDQTKEESKEENTGELVEVEFDLDKLDPSDSVQLKQRNDVYYEMYRDARRKAKEARNLALAAYLDAKRIKNTYMLDEIDSDDSDLDFDEDDDEETPSPPK